MLVNIKKRYAYGIMGLLVLAVGIFIVYALTPGVAPNPGHLITQVAPPAGCGSGQVLGWFGSSWGCVDMASSGVGACSDCDNRYYTESETYTQEQINAMISAIETGGGCPVGYTYYEQSTETAQCYPDGEEISTVKQKGYDGQGDYVWYYCQGRVVNGILQSRAIYPPGDSGWVSGTSTAVGPPNYYGDSRYVDCFVNWNGASGRWHQQYQTYYTDVPLSSFGNVLRVQ